MKKLYVITGYYLEEEEKEHFLSIKEREKKRKKGWEKMEQEQG